MLSLKRMDNFCGKQFQKFIFEFIIKNTIFRTYLSFDILRKSIKEAILCQTIYPFHGIILI